MANRVVCNNAVTRGFVLCPECARSFRSGEVPMDTIRFIDQLAEEIVCDTELPACSFCDRNCAGQVSGLVCRGGVKDWLMSRAKRYFTPDP